MMTVCRVPPFGTFYTKEVSKPLNNQTSHFPNLGILQVGRATSIARSHALPASSHYHFCSLLAKNVDVSHHIAAAVRSLYA